LHWEAEVQFEKENVPETGVADRPEPNSSVTNIFCGVRLLFCPPGAPASTSYRKVKMSPDPRSITPPGEESTTRAHPEGNSTTWQVNPSLLREVVSHPRAER
jgi:hypothetical protein